MKVRFEGSFARHTPLTEINAGENLEEANL
jgi:hypothetical protein